MSFDAGSLELGRDPLQALAVVAALVTILVLSFRIRSDPIAHFPLLGKEFGGYHQRRKAFLKEAVRLYQRGYEEFKDRAYRLTTMDGDRIIVPGSALDELRRLPADHLNRHREISKKWDSRATGIKPVNHFLNRILRENLNQSLDCATRIMTSNVEGIVDHELGLCKDWTSIVIYPTFARLVATLSGAVFIGPENCRNEKFIQSSINFSVDAFKALMKLKRWPYLMRGIVWPLLSETAAVREHSQIAKDFLLPIIRDRREAARNSQKLPDDVLSWMLENAGQWEVSDDGIVDAQMSLFIASVLDTATMITWVLFELAPRPEIAQAMRKEIHSVLKAHGGDLSSVQALSKLKLVDSVMRETQRLNPVSAARFTRYVEKAVTLRDGTIIPQNVVIETAHAAVLNDPAKYPDPDTFDAYRFFRLRADSSMPDPLKYSNREQYQFVVASKDNLSWGYGATACPGRFFAANQIKIILAEILLRYDFRMPGNAKQAYANIISGPYQFPDETKMVEFKRICGPQMRPEKAFSPNPM